MRILFFILIANICLAQGNVEMYPSPITCFCVPSIDIAYNTNGTKAWKIECIDLTLQTCSPNTFQQMVLTTPIKIRDTTVTGWSSTDFYNQLANDSISYFMRTTAATVFPSNGGQDDFGFVFNARLKDPPPYTNCNTTFGTPSGIHGMRMMLALETMNGGYRQGICPSSKRIGGVFLKFKIYTGTTVNTVTLQHTNPSCITLGEPTCSSNCSDRWGSNPSSNNMTGYFTDASLSKLFRNTRNTFRMVNFGSWAGYKPYTNFLINGKRRCQTFASLSCSDLSLADNNNIADIIINSKTQGDCSPVCGSCDNYEEPYWDYQPYSPCPTPTNGSIYFINPNSSGAFSSGTWQIYRNGSLWGSGSLPASSIPVNAGYGSGTNGDEWRVDLNPTGCPTISRKMVSYDVVCPSGCSGTSYIGNITSQPIRASCFFTNGSVLNKLPINSNIDSIKLYTTTPVPYSKYNEYQKYLTTSIPNPSGSTQYLNAWYKKGTCSIVHQYTFINRVCPCETNRYIEFNYNGIDLSKKTALQALGWTVLP